MHGKRVIILAFLKFVCFLIPMWQELMEEAALRGLIWWICKWVKLVWVMHSSILTLWIGRLCCLTPRKSYATVLLIFSNQITPRVFFPLTSRLMFIKTLANRGSESLNKSVGRWEIFYLSQNNWFKLLQISNPTDANQFVGKFGCQTSPFHGSGSIWATCSVTGQVTSWLMKTFIE